MTNNCNNCVSHGKCEREKKELLAIRCDNYEKRKVKKRVITKKVTSCYECPYKTKYRGHRCSKLKRQFTHQESIDLWDNNIKFLEDCPFEEVEE